MHAFSKYFFVGLAILSFNSFAQKFIAQVNKKNVAVGEVFQVSYTISDHGTNFKAPSLSEFDIYSGPNQSTSIQLINGQMSQSFTLSYLIAARKEGKITIGPASINVGGNRIESNSITVEVTKANAQAQKQQQQQNNNPWAATEEEGPKKNDKIGEDEIFIRTGINKKTCYLGEEVTIIHKVYSRHNLKGFQNYKLPAFTGFWSQKAEDKRGQIPVEVENLNGINYYVAEFARTYIFPQRSGSLSIDPAELDVVIRKRSSHKPQNIFEQFFGGGYEDLVVNVKSKPLKLEVKALPEEGKPENFPGTVGRFTYKAEIDKEKVKVNEGINLKLTFQGNGNIKLAEISNLNLPQGLESYEPKVNESINTSSGVSGIKSYEYLIIPREPGNYKLEHLGFSYFDPEKKQYIVLPAPEFNIQVEALSKQEASQQAQVYSNNKQEIAPVENDIRYIKTGDLQLQENESEFFGSVKHYGFIGGSALAFFLFLLIRKEHRKKNSDLTLVKERKAARKAKKALAGAEVFMKQNKKEEFYTEIFLALNRYLSEKLNLPVAELSHDTIHKTLLLRNVQLSTANELNGLMVSCEMAKYAPGQISNELSSIYNQTTRIIETLEDQLKS